MTANTPIYRLGDADLIDRPGRSGVPWLVTL